MMINDFETTIRVRRIDICDLMLACLAAKDAANDDGKKWMRLHDNLQEQLHELDRQLEKAREYA